MAFLKQDQVDQLLKHYSYIKSDGCYIVLHRDEIHPEAWGSICQVVGLDASFSEVKLFIVASTGS